MYFYVIQDYKFVESNEVEFYGIKLLTGKWKDVLYIYGKVKITEQPELDLATLGFTYNIQDPAEFEADDLINDPEFKDYLGAVLQHIMENSLESSFASQKEKVKIKNQLNHNWFKFAVTKLYQLN